VFEETTNDGDMNGTRDGEPLVVDWAAQQGEAEHTQLALRYYKPVLPGALGSLFNLTVRFGTVEASADGTLRLPTEWLSARHVGQLFTNATFVRSPRGAGWWPDPLLPIEPDVGVTVVAGQTTALWLTLSVPSNASPGNYTPATVTVSAVDRTHGATIATSASLVLEVWNLRLKTLAESSFTNFFQFQYQAHPYGADNSAKIRGVLENYYGARTPQVTIVRPCASAFLLEDHRSLLCLFFLAVLSALRSRNYPVKPTALSNNTMKCCSRSFIVYHCIEIDFEWAVYGVNFTIVCAGVRSIA
jgi:hypothetical protein